MIILRVLLSSDYRFLESLLTDILFVDDMTDTESNKNRESRGQGSPILLMDFSVA